MILTGFARLGRDASLRYTGNGDPVLEMALAFNYGQKGQDGKRPSQWIEATLWGKRAEALAQHLTKGAAIDVVLTEPHIETWTKKDQTTGFKLVAKVAELEFAGGGERRSENGAPALKPAAKPQPSGGAGSFNDLEDDIPF